MRLRKLLIFIPAAIILLFFLLTDLLSDLFWYASVGYTPVFLTILITSAALFVIGTLLFFAFSYGNVILAARTGAGTFGVEKEIQYLGGIACAVAAGITGLSLSSSWEIILAFLDQTPFHISDPVFGLDISFYIFSLPFYTILIQYLLALFVFTLIISSVMYAAHRAGVRIDEYGVFQYIPGPFPFGLSWKDTVGRFLPQVNCLLFLIFTTLAAFLWLSRYSTLYTSKGTVMGAGYTDVTITIPALTILTVIAFLIGVLFLLNEKIRRPEMIAYGIGGFFLIAILSAGAGFLVQTLIVEPNEFNLERTYLGYNINSTLDGYNLANVNAQDFPVLYNLTETDIRNNNATISNIRLWDWRPMKTTLEQLQLFRTYYTFNDVDVDRYWLDGNYKQVHISAREMNSYNLPQQAQTWVNRYLVYTHGYGAVMSPVDRITANGLPEFFVKDIPPSSPFPSLSLDHPQIYYGEGDIPYCITNTRTEEFDYPSGDENIYSLYDGNAGVELSLLPRLVYAIQLGSVELLVSGSLTPDSKLHLYRNILERTSKIAPFLTYDSDPYVVMSDGKLSWIIDAYTTSDRYPYSEPVRTGELSAKSMNYVRNSVKVIVDAYTGDIRYYIVDPDDPVIQTYAKMFPGLFRPVDDIPDDLRSHLRYPHGLFNIQAEIYGIYHMTDPRVFYNREDAWVIPDEIYRKTQQRFEPYYVIMKLPGEEREEFILMLPFTPRNKQNLIGWMAVRCDPDRYGEMIVYQFSKQELTYGPMQIEARIDQDTDISQSITLWSQAGSSVVRGNTLIIPVEQSLLYVEPLYLEATQKGTLPQLQRVIVSYGDKLTMQPTLNEALQVIFGGRQARQDIPKRMEQPGDDQSSSILGQISGLYKQAQQALSSGSLGEYQQFVDRIGTLVSGY